MLHSAFGFESMNGYLTSMLHSTYRVADQLLFSVDVHNTLSTLCDKLEHTENEHTLSFLESSLGSFRRNNMTLLHERMYAVGPTASEKVPHNEREAIRALTNAELDQAVVFHRLYNQGTIFHSTHYGREGGKRNSSVCAFLHEGKECYGTLQKFIICPGYEPLVVVAPLPPSRTTFLNTVGRPGREVLEEYTDINLSKN